MRKTKEVLRLRFEAALSNRQIARATGISCSTVSETVGRLKAAGLSWPLPEGLSEAALERRLYRPKGEVADVEDHQTRQSATGSVPGCLMTASQDTPSM